MVKIDISVNIITREFHPCKIGRAPLQRQPGTVRCRAVPSRASGDVHIHRRRPAPVRYVTTKDKIL